MYKRYFHQNFSTRTVFLILFLSPAFYSFSQTDKLSHSLEYINAQFKKFNSYNLQFQLDKERKNLLSTSIYFEVNYPLGKLATIYYTQRADKDCIVFFKCKNDEQCIKSLNLDDKKHEIKSEYSFNLGERPEIAEKVVTEFITLKNNMINADDQDLSIPVAINSELNDDIEFINKMLRKYNSFNVQFNIDWVHKLLLSRSTYFDIIYDPTTVNSIELISRGENDFKINFTCKSQETCLTSVQVRDHKSEFINNYPVNFNGSIDEAKKIIDVFNHILQNLK